MRHTVFPNGGHDFRPEYAELFRLRAALGLHIPVCAYTATLTPRDRGNVVENLGMNKHATFELSVNRPNIFLARQQYDASDQGVSILEDVIEQLLAFRANCPRHLIYTRTKDLARVLAMAMAQRIGQHDAKTDGVARVNWYHAGLCDEARRAIMKDFGLADSEIRALCSSNALGMGSDLLCLYIIMGIDPPVDLEDWMQQIGRAGRDGKQSIATLYFDSGRLAHVSAAMRAFCRDDVCLRLQLARLFNPLVQFKELFECFEGKFNDAELAVRCCSVCAARGTVVEPSAQQHNPARTTQVFQESLTKLA